MTPSPGAKVRRACGLTSGWPGRTWLGLLGPDDQSGTVATDADNGSLDEDCCQVEELSYVPLSGHWKTIL